MFGEEGWDRLEHGHHGPFTGSFAISLDQSAVQLNRLLENPGIVGEGNSPEPGAGE